MELGEGVTRAAEPLLASTLIGDGELEDLVEEVLDEKKGARRREGLLETGIKSLDDALEGGLEGGGVVGVSGEVGAGGMELSFTLLANSLLQKPTSSAAILDTAGNLDILRLYTLITARLKSNSSLLNTLRALSENNDASAEDVTAKVLDRVKVMRVFDLVGIVEAIGEVRDSLEGRKPEDEGTAEKQGEGPTMASKEQVSPEEPLRRTVVADSEDEDDEEMLFEPETAPVVAPDVLPEQDNQPERSQELSRQPEEKEAITFILIDNLAQVVNPLLKKDYIQTHSLVSSFLLSLSNLTRTHTLHTVLLNPASVPRQYPPKEATQPQPQQQQLLPQPSIFSSNKAIPALGNILPQYLDLHLMVSKMPKRKVDARVVYSEGGGSGSRFKKGLEMVSVMEVISDRWGRRIGGWGVFAEGEKGMR